MKKLYWMLALMISVCAFTGCSDDDNENNGPLVGRWTTEEYYYADIIDGKEDTDNAEIERPAAGDDVYTFYANGTVVNEYKDEDDGKTYKDSGAYTYDETGKKLTLSYKEDNGTQSSETYTVTSLTSSRLVIEDKTTGYVERITLKKI